MITEEREHGFVKANVRADEPNGKLVEIQWELTKSQNSFQFKKHNKNQ